MNDQAFRGWRCSASLGSMGAARALIAISVGIAVPACALFTDLGGFSNGDDETSSADTGSNPNTDAADTGDRIAEGGTTTLDGGTDASCGHLFCEDFDDDAGFSRWQPFVSTPSASSFTMRIDTAAASSPPSSLLLSATPARWGEWGYLQKVFDLGSATTLRCSFDMRLDEVPPDGQYTLGGFVAAEVESPHTVLLFVRGGGARIGFAEEWKMDGGTSGAMDGPPLGVEQWRSFVITLQRGPSPSFKISDGVGVYTLAMPSWPATPKVALSLGVMFANPFALEDVDLRTRYDNIHCDAL